MLGTKRLCRAVIAALLLVPGAGALTARDAAAQGQPTQEAYALYDRLGPGLIQQSGVPVPESAETPVIACQRYGQALATIVRFAVASSLAPGLTLDSQRAESHRQAAEVMAEDAQNGLNQLGAAGANMLQCAALARTYGAAAFTFAQSINRANVARNVDRAFGPAPKPEEAGKSADEAAAEQAAQAEVERQSREKEEAEQRAKDKVDHAFANLGPVTPAPAKSQAGAMRFNIYLINTPAMREAKDFRLCFEPNLYQRAAKPVVDLVSAGLEVPEAAAVIDQALADFFKTLQPLIAGRFGFPADRLFVDSGDAATVRGPTTLPARAVRDGCHVYLAAKPPPLAYDDRTTTFGLLAENISEDVLLRPALQQRLAALPRLEALVKPEVTSASETEPARVSVAARPEIARCVLNLRCNAGAQLAVNACMQVAERRIGKAAIARELEVRAPVVAAVKKDEYDADATRDFDLISRNLEQIDGELGHVLERLAQNATRLRQAASAQLSNQEVDAVIAAGRSEGEQAMGAPVLQCFSRIADGRAIGLGAPQ
jgi:hypothetical protein